MRKHRRSILEIKLEILRECLEPKKVTHLHRKVNINNNLCKDLLQELIQKGLLMRGYIKKMKGGKRFPVFVPSNPKTGKRYFYVVTEEGQVIAIVWQRIKKRLAEGHRYVHPKYWFNKDLRVTYTQG